MLTRFELISALTIVLPFVPAHAASVYVVNGSQQFGSIDLGTGAFHPIGPTGSEPGYFGLAAGPNGSLKTFAYSSNVYSIDPATGKQTLLGPSGLDNCSTVSSPCGPTSNASLGGLNGKIYATDFQNNLYTLNPQTGAAKLIGSTGIAAIPFVPGSLNPDGTINFYDEAVFGAGGKLYETFDAFVFNLATFSVVKTNVAPALYQIDPATGRATLVGRTELGIGAVAGVSGVYYAFDDLTNQISALNLAIGSTSLVSSFDSAAGVIQGAAPVAPEPASIALSGVGIVAALVWRRRCFTR